MNKQEIPKLCDACIKRIQQVCTHRHSTMMGGFHFTAGEVWDDLQLFCLDCGANLDRCQSTNLIIQISKYLFRRLPCKN